MDVVVGTGGWEHQCCGEAFDRDDVVDLGCSRTRDADGAPRFEVARHDTPVVERIAGRVVATAVVHPDGTVQEVLRVPSGQALCGFDPHDDGHLEDPWTGEVVLVGGGEEEFLVTVRVPGRRVLDPSAAYRPGSGARGVQ